jgi:hypothetical protein
MVKRFEGETILARWVVDAAALHNFVQETRHRSKLFSSVPKDLLKECEKHAAAGAGLEVVVREDAVFVGDWGSPNWFCAAQVHDTWMQFMGDEGYHIPVPLAPGARAEAERIAAIYWALDEKARVEAQRQFDEERAKPTWNNRLLHFAEVHFVWLVLGLFFVLIPLFLLLLGFLRGSLSG